MMSLGEIQKAIDKLPAKQKTALKIWMESRDEPPMTTEEEMALLASIDRAAQQLDSGKGERVEKVRAMVRKWAGN